MMSGPVSCHLPVDASLHSFNSLDYGFGTGESPFLAGSSDATCGAAAVRAVSQYLNLEPMRAVVSFADTPGQLAQPAPSEALVARERDAARGDRPWEEQQLGVDELTASGRTGAVEDVSTSHDVAEVRLGLFRTPHTRGAPSIRGFDAHATARAAFSGRAPDRDSSFSPAPRPTHPAGFLSPELRRLGRRTTGGRAVQQGTSSLRLRLPAIAPNAAATDARASARRLVFGKREHVTSCFRRSTKTRASDAFFLDASRAALLRDAKQGPMRTLSARTFETLLDESNVRENEVRTRPANEPRYAPNARFLVRNEPFAFPEPGTRKTRVASRRRRTPPNPSATRGAFPNRNAFSFFDSATKRFRSRARRRARSLFSPLVPAIGVLCPPPSRRASDRDRSRTRADHHARP